MIKVTDKQYWMDAYLKSNLDSMIYDAEDDWDFVIIITGDGMVRVGKSVLAQQVGYYFAYHLKRKWDAKGAGNIVFSGEELIKAATDVEPSVFIYDEARADLDSKKALAKVSKVLQDFFAECGMYNHILILVLPDFFELNKRIATSRSECLINVFRMKKEVKYKGDTILSRKRGRFFFYGSEKKRLLYIKGKKDNDNYNAVKSNFWGDFKDYWLIDRAAYDKKKKAFLARDRAAEGGNRYQEQRDILIKIMYGVLGLTQQDIAQHLDNFGIKMSQRNISKIVAKT